MKTKPLNPDSEYYRICKNCNIEFMADDFREKYCCHQCHDIYHRRLNRFRRACEPLVSPTIIPLNAPSERSMLDLKKNIQILLSYQINREGLWISNKELEEKGFIFEVYSSIIQVDGKENKYFVEYGPFIINRETKNSLFIRIKNQKK